MAKKKFNQRRTQLPRVAVLVDTSTQWGRQIIRGVTSYAQQNGPWHLQVEPRGRDDRMQLPRDWDGDGIIARVANTTLAKDLSERSAAIINISGINLSGYHFRRVMTDYDAVASLAAEHFRSRGFQRFAYVGPLKVSYVKSHADAFEQRIVADGDQLQRFNYAFESMSSERWQVQRRKLSRWLANLEKPIAIFCWGTAASCQLLDICRLDSIIVPDEVAVLAGDNDDVISATTVPPMSAILNPALQIGFHAAQRLDRMMKNVRDEDDDELIPPIEVVTRGSTDVLAIEDDELLRAVRYMREHAFSPLTVKEVADSVPLTRRSLERKFREWVGRSPLAEIHRLRIARVKELLATTDMPMSRISLATGFGTPEYMATAFKKEMNMTPLRYRSMTRAR
ncbi:xylose operon transcription regulator XylR [Rhodopirellula sp. SWK7]|uniref:AraC family transcriptional regulator n=1 Tax=Rhodopirellula sp. SWK7 TaxID=595460 RepID=UPI0002C0145B|nr:xylose operon transcription regulator XylR [Rhodopirellula sp. SWK7]EMI43508.1 xylose operon regulatory protein [Rhodopirellula sp. SWK7]